VSAPIELPPIPTDAEGLTSEQRAELEGRKYEPGEKTQLEMLAAAAKPIPGEEGGPVPAAAAAPTAEARVKLVDRLDSGTPWARGARVTQATLGRDLEMRIFPTGYTDHQAALFFQELRNLSNLDHPGFLPVHDSMVYKGCPCYLVPLREDPRLTDLVEEREFTLAERCRVVRSLADALAGAHARGILLGPVLPARIGWDGASGRAYYRNLGMSPDDWRDQLLQHTPLYGAREPFSERNDVFAWGLLAFWMLSGGQHAYGAGPEDARCLRILEPQLAPGIGMAIEASLAWDPELRPEGGGVLQSILASDVQDLSPPGSAPPEELPIEEVSRRALSRAGTKASGFGTSRPAPRGVMRPGELEAAFRVPGAESTTDLGKMTQMAGRMGLTLLPDDPVAYVERRRKEWPLWKKAALLWGGLVLALLIVLWARMRPPAAPDPVGIEAKPVKRVVKPRKQLARPGHETVEVKELISHRGDVIPEDFEALWRKLQALVVQKKLPEGVTDGKKMMNLWIRFKRDPKGAAKELQGLIEKLRTKVAPAQAPAPQ
jgi:hypothetical protein